MHTYTYICPYKEDFYVHCDINKDLNGKKQLNLVGINIYSENFIDV